MTPTVYFIDDSATMREVIKIAFRRENINVIACHDGASALAQMQQEPPHVVITDVIMPEKDGYEVCQEIKRHPQLGKTPVILMSGVVNRAVAEKAFAVKADELIRKPFQPQDLIARVRYLLNPRPAEAPASANASAALSSIFASAVPGRQQARPMSTPAQAPPPRVPVMNEMLAPPTAQAPAVPVTPAPPSSPRAAAPRSNGTGIDLQKLRSEVLRLEHLIKKLQSELEAEREYSRALEAHIKTLQDSE